MTSPNYKYKCKHINSKHCYHNNLPINITRRDCPIIRYKMLTHNVCDDKGIVDVGWTQLIKFYDIFNEDFIKL